MIWFRTKRLANRCLTIPKRFITAQSTRHCLITSQFETVMATLDRILLITLNFLRLVALKP